MGGSSLGKQMDVVPKGVGMGGGIPPPFVEENGK